MNESFDFSLVPYTFGLCAAEGCPRAATCLRRIALEHAPDGACDYYRSDEKVRYARGFMCTINALTVRVADTFRYRMIGYMGRKNYYLKRKGGINLSPADQQQVIAVAKELGVIRKDYFDGYVEEYNWE